jgi:NADH:ubiquinone reductase (H+-translocating)
MTTSPARVPSAGTSQTGRPRVVIVGSGFGGLFAAQRLRKADVDITLIGKTSHHLFQPLLYQVATGILSEGEIAPSTREVLRRQENARVVLGEVVDIDLAARTVTSTVLGRTTVHPYDELIVAAGAGQSYFGNDRFAEFAPGMKSIDDALELRGRIFGAFELAELATDQAEIDRLMTFVVVGAGPTGVEMAGQIAELARDTLPGDFRAIDPSAGRVLIVEASDRVLPGFPPALSERAARSLRELGVTVLVGHTVVDVDSESVRVRRPDGETDEIVCRTVVWAAGVEASPLARALAEASGAELDRAGRVTVEPDLTVSGRPEVLALGDMAQVRGQPLPGLAPVAMQQGRYAGRLIADRLAQRRTPPFRYRDRGKLATIGRARAVADLRGLRLAGFPAWAIWLVVHLVYLVGFENRAVVLVRWAYNFFTHGRGGRLITHP